MQPSRTNRIVRAALLIGCALLPLSCGDAPERVDPHEGVDTQAAEQAPAVALYFGEVRLTGELAKVTEGTVYVYARQPGTRDPMLIENLPVQHFQADGDDKVQGYQLTMGHTMGGMEVEIPENLELKIYYDPDGMVDTPEGQEVLILQTTPGEKRYDAVLHDGMQSADEAPSSLDVSDE